MEQTKKLEKKQRHSCDLDRVIAVESLDICLYVFGNGHIDTA